MLPADSVASSDGPISVLAASICKGRIESVAAGGRKTERPIPTLPFTRGLV